MMTTGSENGEILNLELEKKFIFKLLNNQNHHVSSENIMRVFPPESASYSSYA